MTQVTDGEAQRQARIASHYDESGFPLPAAQRRERERITKTLAEMYRLREAVERYGWQSTSGQALLTLVLNNVCQMVADSNLLAEKVKRLEDVMTGLRPALYRTRGETDT